MFYSHEILTSRKYGIATVWLVATLGAKSTTIKVNRKEILGVDVKKACETVIQPTAPMALRLQSSLLYGISRVYSQQCGYVLQDAQTAQNNIRALFKIVKGSDIDAETGPSRPDQLILMDDPAFTPDVALPALNFDTSNQALEDSQYSLFSSMVSPGQSGTSKSSQASILGLQIPTSHNDTPEQYRLPTHFQLGSSPQGVQSGIKLFDDEGQGLLDDLDFGFDEDGGMVSVNADDSESKRASVRSTEDGHPGSELAASKRVMRDHKDALVASSLAHKESGYGEDLVMQMDDDLNLLPDAEAFSTHLINDSQEERNAEKSPASAAVPMRKRKTKPRPRKILSDEDGLEIRNAEFKDWQKNYVNDMHIAKQESQRIHGKSHAKTIASNFIWNNGIGGIGRIICSIGGETSHPLDIFCAEELRKLITGNEEMISTNRKRSHSMYSEDDNELARNVRGRHDLGNGLPRDYEDDGSLPVFDDEMMPPPEDTGAVEIGREALSPLTDYHSSAMPWNISSSLKSFRLGSSLPRGPARQSSIMPSRPGSRLASASPSFGRGRIFDADEAKRTDFSPFRDIDTTSAVGAEDFEILGPSANVDTQTAQNSQWLAEALETESFNVLEFVRASAAEEAVQGRGKQARNTEGDEEEWKDGSLVVTFDSLFPPQKSHRIVAAQAFYHVLSLATKNLMKVQQGKSGDITMVLKE